AKVSAQLRGPVDDAPTPGCIAVEIVIELIPHEGQGEPEQRRVDFCIDLQDERLLAPAVSLAETPLDRSGLALLIGELESWCYEHIPVRRMPDDKPVDD
ncbi:MAG: hypothetical protein KC431_11550, partial [Myxococcales bacterium]|nr:hypothetical protein [Myxococcales bacterium]